MKGRIFFMKLNNVFPGFKYALAMKKLRKIQKLLHGSIGFEFINIHAFFQKHGYGESRLSCLKIGGDFWPIFFVKKPRKEGDQILINEVNLFQRFFDKKNWPK